MKRIIVCIILLLAVHNVFSQPYKAFNLVKNDSLPGISNVEVTVLDYLFFLSAKVNSYQKQAEMDRLDSIPADTAFKTVFRSLLPDSTALHDSVKFYFRNLYTEDPDSIKLKSYEPKGYCKQSGGFRYDKIFESFRIYETPSSKVLAAAIPVTGVSLKQAQEYCKWECKKVNLNSKLYELKYRLITPEEYDKILRFYTHKGKSCIDSVAYKDGKPCCMMENFKCIGNCPESDGFFERYGGESPVFVAAFFYTRGMYDLYGNVSEMTSVEGIAKGANYSTPISVSYPGKIISYSKPEKWLGFRVACEITELKK